MALDLSMIYFGNSLNEYLVALGITALIFIAAATIRQLVYGSLKKVAKMTSNKYDDLIIASLEALPLKFYFFLSLYVGSRYITMIPNVENTVDGLLMIFLTFYVCRVITALLDAFLDIQINSNQYRDDSILDLVKVLSKWVIWILAALFVLSNFGINITSLIAGLGVGGIAIALALQNVLTDIFSAITIYFDKPFSKGDFIILESGQMGTVKKIGIKSTRVETLHGEELVVSNRELTQAKIHNYKKMKKRRVVMEIGVIYQTKTAKMKKIPEMVEKIFQSIENADLDRCHFKTFAASSLNFEICFYMTVPDYKSYMDTLQEVNFEIKEAFEKSKIEFAYPTQTIFLEK